MKKSIIAAGASAVALAAMPVVGVFASEQTISITDTIQPTIPTSCSFLRYGAVDSTSETGATNKNWSGPESGAAATTTGVYSATITAGSLATLGQSSFSGYCNVDTGFSVTVDAPSLSNGSNSTINLLTSAMTGGTHQGYTIYRTSGAAAYLNDDGTLMSANGATISTEPVTATVQYQVSTTASTPSGTYSGNVVYTFTYDDPNISA